MAIAFAKKTTIARQTLANAHTQTSILKRSK